MSFKPVQAQRFSLAGSGCTSTATTIVLASFKLPNATLIEMANFGDIGFLTLEPGTSREENISFTGVTQNVNKTATLTGVTRGLAFTYPYAETAGNKFAHAGGSVCILTNNASFYDNLFPQAIQDYVDTSALSGGVNSSTTVKGIVEEATSAEITAGTTVGGTGARLFTNPSTLLDALRNAVEITSGVTHSLTTTAGQRVVVWAKGTRSGNVDSTITLKYNTVTKDTVSFTSGGGSYYPTVPFALQYTEIPGAGTQNITVETSGGSISNVVIIVIKI
jgi:hypothetical protein